MASELSLVVKEEGGWVVLDEEEDGWVLVDEQWNNDYQVVKGSKYTLVCVAPKSLLCHVIPLLYKQAPVAFLVPYDCRTSVGACVMGVMMQLHIEPESAIFSLPLNCPLQILKRLVALGIVPFEIRTSDWMRLFMGSDIRLLQALPSLTFDFLGMDARQLLAPFFRAIDAPLPSRSEMFVASACSVASRTLNGFLLLAVKAYLAAHRLAQ